MVKIHIAIVVGVFIIYSIITGVKERRLEKEELAKDQKYFSNILTRIDMCSDSIYSNQNYFLNFEYIYRDEVNSDAIEYSFTDSRETLSKIHFACVPIDFEYKKIWDYVEEYYYFGLGRMDHSEPPENINDGIQYVHQAMAALSQTCGHIPFAERNSLDEFKDLCRSSFDILKNDLYNLKANVQKYQEDKQ